MNQFIYFFIKKLRLSNPWKFKAPFLITIPYFIFLLSNNHGEKSFLSILASITIIIGVAGLGYLTNDLGDRKKDEAINKPNATHNISNSSILLLFVLFLSLAILPWLYLPFNKWSIALLSTQCFLFYAYAFKPLRLKERGFWGIITDALYAHVVPAILASYTFYLQTQMPKKHYVFFLLLLCLWQFMLGIRNIMFHQLKDYDNDLSSQTNTFATYYGFDQTTRFVKRVVLPVEISLFVIFTIYSSYYYTLFPVFILVYWIYKAVNEKSKITTFSYRELAYKFLDDLYIQWIPFVVLGLLCYNSFNYLPLLLLHVLIFRSEAKTALINFINSKTGN